MKKILSIGTVVSFILLSVGYIAYANGTVVVHDLLDAIAESESTDKEIFVMFTADWCGACRAMKKEIMANPEVFEKHIVCLINYDDYPDLVKEYKVKLIPDYFILRNKVEIKRQKGYMSISKLESWISNDK